MEISPVSSKIGSGNIFYFFPGHFSSLDLASSIAAEISFIKIP
jgi:hypothetical protein